MSHLHHIAIKDGLSNLQDLTLSEFHLLMTRDPVFCDYFNKYCCLPIFGQKIAFLLDKGKFIYDPPPPSAERKQKIGNDLVRDWLFVNRFKSFSNTKAAKEYKLCTILCNANFESKFEMDCWPFREFAETNLGERNNMDYRTLMRAFQVQQIGGVSRMAKFRQFVSSFKHGRQLLNFWLDAEELRSLALPSLDQWSESTKQDRGNLVRKCLRSIQRKYYHRTSKFCLNHRYLEIGLPKFIKCDFEFTMRLQEQILQRLENYWFPRYLLHKANILVDEQDIESAVNDFEDEEELLNKMLHRSSMVKFLRNLKSSGNLSTTEFGYGEDGKIVVVKEEQKREVWDKATASNNAVIEKESTEYIHKSSFDEDEDVDVTAKTVSQKKSALRDSKTTKITKSTTEKIAQSPSFAKSPISQTVSAHGYEGDESSDDDALDFVSDLRKKHQLRKKKDTQRTIMATPTISEDIEFVTDTVVTMSKTTTQSKEDLKSVPGSTRTRSRVSQTTSSTSTFSSSTGTSKSSISIVSPILAPSVSPSPFSSSCGTETSSTTMRFGSIIQDCESDTEVDSVHQSDRRKLLGRDVEQKKLAEILISDELSGYIFRVYLQRGCSQDEEEETDDESTLCEKEGVESKRGRRRSLVPALDFWRDMEQFRRIYFTQDCHDLMAKYEEIVKNYVHKDVLLNKPYTSESLRKNVLRLLDINVDNSIPFPTQLIALQNDLEKILKNEWMHFASLDRSTFQSNVMPMYWKVFRKRNLFPSCVSDIRSIPILRLPRKNLANTGDSMLIAEENKILDELPNLLGYSGQGQMRYRSSRAVHLFLLVSARCPSTCGPVCGHYVNDYDCGIGAEIDSEDDGAMPPLPRRKYVRLPEIDTKHLASMSIKEYPKSRCHYNYTRIVKKVERYRMKRKPFYMRPIRKGGVLIPRPERRPSGLKEVLHDPVHSMFFKNYLKIHKSETPLLFWKNVDSLKNTEDARLRQKKAQGIMKKFFGRLSGGGVLLQCQDDLIKKIGKKNSVTTSELVDAQGLVFSSMEKNWGDKYLNTFPDDLKNLNDKDAQKDDKDIRESRPWKIFGDFIRRGANFIKCMRKVKNFNEFRKWLKDYPARINNKAAGDASHTSITQDTFMYKSDGREYVKTVAVQNVLGRKVVLDFLQNDLCLWLEVDRFNLLLENAQFMYRIGNLHQSDVDIVKNKAHTIIKCFLDSPVMPRLRINMDTEKSKATVTAINSGKVGRAMFHEPLVSTFPVLLHFWRKFTSEKHQYISKKSRNIMRRQNALRRRAENSRRFVCSRVKKKFDALARSQSATISERGKNLPDYVTGLVKQNAPFERVKGLIPTDFPTLHFSLQHGIKFIIPPRRRMTLASEAGSQDEEEFLNVWTGDGKTANVIGIGSDPKLFDDDSNERVFSVECDFIE